MIKCILFDNNGVLTTNDYERTYELTAKYLGVSQTRVKELFSPHIVDLDTGRITQNEFYARVLRDAKIKRPIDEFASIRLGAYIPKKDIQALAKKLSGKYSIALLSNFGDAFWKQYALWGLDNLFERKNVFVSSDIGMAKPNPEIFQHTLNKLSLKPNEVVFIDDNEDNIKQAKAMGIVAILCTNYSSLIFELKKLGISSR